MLDKVVPMLFFGGISRAHLQEFRRRQKEHTQKQHSFGDAIWVPVETVNAP